MSIKAIPTPRGCGTRVAGGVYLETGFGPGGQPVESFLLCPPLLLNLHAMGITAVGTKLIERQGVFHVFDMVGSEHYPNVADYIEETRRFGVSRRVSRNTDFSKLTADSRLILIHAKAYIENFEEYAAKWVVTQTPCAGHPVPRCPKHIVAHDQAVPPGMCAGVYWQDIANGTALPAPCVDRSVERTMPSFKYRAFCRPEGVVPKYLPAAFASFPISRIVAIHADAKEDEANRKRLGSAKLPTDFERE